MRASSTRSRFLAAGLILTGAAGPAFADLTFTGSTSVVAGTLLEIDAVLTQNSLPFINTATIIVNFDDLVGTLGFTYDSDWEDAFAAAGGSAMTPEIDQTGLPPTVTVGGSSIGAGTVDLTGPPLPLGTFTIDTTGMPVGDYSLAVSELSDIGFSGEFFIPETISGSFAFEVTPIPAPGALLLAAMGLGLVRLVRRPLG